MYIFWLKLMVIDWTEKLYMIAIFNQVESGASAVRSKWTSLGYPWMVTVTPEHGSTHGDTLTWQGGTSLNYPWQVTVTLA